MCEIKKKGVHKRLFHMTSQKLERYFTYYSNFLCEIKKRRLQATFPYDIPIIFPNVYIWSSLLNSKKFVFPAFEFSDFNNQCPDVYIKRGDIQKTYEFGTNLRSYLKKAPKVLYQALQLEETSKLLCYSFQYLTKHLLLHQVATFHIALLWVDL